MSQFRLQITYGRLRRGQAALCLLSGIPLCPHCNLVAVATGIATAAPRNNVYIAIPDKPAVMARSCSTDAERSANAALKFHLIRRWKRELGFRVGCHDFQISPGAMKYDQQNRDSAHGCGFNRFVRGHEALSTVRRPLRCGHLAILTCRCAALMLAALLFSLSVAAQAEPLQLQPPVQPACISSPFGWRRAIGPNAPAGFHNGIDLPAPAGAIVRAAAAGTISGIRRQGLGGVAIRIAHADGVSTLYAHLGNLAPAIAQGKRTVAAGEPLARVARTGVTYGTHLFFAVFVRGAAVDPLTMLDVPPCGDRP